MVTRLANILGAVVLLTDENTWREGKGGEGIESERVGEDKRNTNRPTRGSWGKTKGKKEEERERRKTK